MSPRPRHQGRRFAWNHPTPTALDAWLDQRWEHALPVEPLLATLAAAGLDAAGVEGLLRAGRAAYPALPCKRGAISRRMALACEHVDHATGYLLYVPSDYDPARAWPLVVIGHGGSVGRDLAFGEWAAHAGMEPFWCEAAEEFGLVLLAPLTDRGWGAIGNSILFSAISHATRTCHVDPDRIFLTGHSMGGHLAWRSAMNFADRFGAVSPMSGGYNFVADRSIENLVNCPGYATWGTHEPYGIGEANRVNRDWLRAHGGDWAFKECAGGHEIFPECVPRVAEFFLAHPRELYRGRVRVRGGGPLEFATADAHPQWGRAHAWIAGRPIAASTCHWLRLEPLPPYMPGAVAVPEVAATFADNTFTIASVNARRFHLGLHHRMVDLARPVAVRVNGDEVFRGVVQPDVATMLRLVREFDDRGRVFHAVLDIDVPAAPRGGAPRA